MNKQDAYDDDFDADDDDDDDETHNIIVYKISDHHFYRKVFLSTFWMTADWLWW